VRANQDNTPPAARQIRSDPSAIVVEVDGRRGRRDRWICEILNLHVVTGPARGSRDPRHQAGQDRHAAVGIEIEWLLRLGLLLESATVARQESPPLDKSVLQHFQRRRINVGYAAVIPDHDHRLAGRWINRRRCRDQE
jgi:hypothetical protein